MTVQYFDIRTLSLVTSISSISIFSLMLFILLRRKTYVGYAEWTIGTLFNSLSTILIGLRDFIPDFFSIIVANNLILLRLVFIIRGLSKFSNSKHKLWFDILLVIILNITFIIFTYLSPNVNYRIIILLVFTVIECFRISIIIWRQLPKVIPDRQIFLFTTFGLFGLWNLIRLILTAFFEGRISDFMDAGTIQGLAFIVTIAANIIYNMLLNNCNSQRLELELGEAKEEIRKLSGILPICTHCKKIRNNEGQWVHLEEYISTHSDANFSHGVCPSCLKKYYPDLG